MSTKKQTADRPDPTRRPSSGSVISTKISEIEAHFLFETGAFSTKISEIETHFLFEKEAFSTKISEIEAHFFFEKGAFSTRNGEIEVHVLFTRKTEIRNHFGISNDF